MISNTQIMARNQKTQFFSDQLDYRKLTESWKLIMSDRRFKSFVWKTYLNEKYWYSPSHSMHDYIFTFQAYNTVDTYHIYHNKENIDEKLWQHTNFFSFGNWQGVQKSYVLFNFITLVLYAISWTKFDTSYHIINKSIVCSPNNHVSMRPCTIHSVIFVLYETQFFPLSSMLSSL